MKDKKVLIVYTFLILVISLLIAAVFLLTKKKEEEFPNNYDSRVEIITNKYPTKIVIYGENIPFRNNVKFDKVNEINEEIFKNPMVNNVFIINDMNGKLEISDDEWEIIRKFTFNGNYDFYYIGNNQFGNIMKYFNVPNFDDEDISYAYLYDFEYKVHSSGFWDIEAQKKYLEDGTNESLGNRILRKIVSQLKNLYGE